MKTEDYTDKCGLCHGTGEGYAAGTVCPACRGAKSILVLKTLEDHARMFTNRLSGKSPLYPGAIQQIPDMIKTVPGVTVPMVLAGWLYGLPYVVECRESELEVRFGEETLALLREISFPNFAKHGMDAFKPEYTPMRWDKLSREARIVETAGIVGTAGYWIEKDRNTCYRYVRIRRRQLKFIESELQERAKKLLTLYADDLHI